jgi:hypothetical protein
VILFTVHTLSSMIVHMKGQLVANKTEWNIDNKTADYMKLAKQICNTEQ